MKTAIQTQQVLGGRVASGETKSAGLSTVQSVESSNIRLADLAVDARPHGRDMHGFPANLRSAEAAETRHDQRASTFVGRDEAFPPARPTPLWKRTFDIAVLLMVAPVAGPLLLAAALWVTLVSKGKVLFVQERVGVGGKRFKCFKLRTMHQGCATATHERHLQQLLKEDRPMLKLDHGDPRLIAGARLLRALGIDELPQLINVARGDMSVVGPRPCIPYEAEQYEFWQRERFSVLPGLTGLWQVKGKNRTTFLQMVKLDIEYANRQSAGLDLWILLSTPKAILSQVAFAIRAKSGKSRRRLSSNGPVPMATAGESGVVG